MKTFNAKKILAYSLLTLSLGLTGCLTDDKNDESSGPTISVDPSDVTLSAGSTATFTVVASGTGSLTYQWMRNDVNIAGATSATYSTPAGSSDDGAEYKVKVTDTKGSTTSHGAFLRILVTEQTVTLGAQNSATASSWDLDNGATYTASNAPAHSSEIDLVFAFNTTADSSALYSPAVAKSGVGGTAGFDFMQSWSTANSTDIHVVSVANWSTVTTQDAIKSLYDQGSNPTPSGRVFLKVGTTVVAKSNGGKYVLIRVNSVTHSASGTANFTAKAKS